MLVNSKVFWVEYTIVHARHRRRGTILNLQDIPLPTRKGDTGLVTVCCSELGVAKVEIVKSLWRGASSHGDGNYAQSEVVNRAEHLSLIHI